MKMGGRTFNITSGTFKDTLTVPVPVPLVPLCNLTTGARGRRRLTTLSRARSRSSGETSDTSTSPGAGVWWVLIFVWSAPRTTSAHLNSLITFLWLQDRGGQPWDQHRADDTSPELVKMEPGELDPFGPKWPGFNVWIIYNDFWKFL